MYQLNPTFVNAEQLTWDNWQTLADACRGRFHQRISTTQGMTGFLEVPDVHSTFQVCRLGDYLVEEASGFFTVWTQFAFESNFTAVSSHAELDIPLAKVI